MARDNAPVGNTCPSINKAQDAAGECEDILQDLIDTIDIIYNNTDEVVNDKLIDKLSDDEKNLINEHLDNLSYISSDIAQKKGDFSDLIDILEDLRSENQELREWGNELYEKVENLEREVDLLEGSKEDLESEIEELNDEIVNLNKENEDLTNQLEKFEEV